MRVEGPRQNYRVWEQIECPLNQGADHLGGSDRAPADPFEIEHPPFDLKGLAAGIASRPETKRFLDEA